jgi:hypothetical protein
MIYARNNVGGGVAFLDVNEKYKYVLEQWMEQASKTWNKRIGKIS